MQDLYITGAGIVSAIGLSLAETERSLREERSGIAPVRYLDTAMRHLPVGEVKADNDRLSRLARLRGDARDMPRSSLMAAVALREALTDAGLTADEVTKTHFVSGSTVGGMDKSESHYLDFLCGKGPVDDIRRHDVGINSILTADTAGHFASVTTLSTACSSAANAIAHAALLIRTGAADCVVAGGTECLTRFHLSGFRSLMIVDDEPCRPFCATRRGLNLGEGAAYLVIESRQSAERRGAAPLARLSGWGNACDAFHQTATSPEGEGAVRAMRQALDDARLCPADIDYINAHGTGTPDNDRSEGRAMLRLFGTAMPPYSSTKAFTGHTTSASGAIEAVICLLALRGGFIPANLRLREAVTTTDAAAPMPPPPVAHTLDGMTLRHVMCNSFGFGGNDTSLIFSAV